MIHVVCSPQSPVRHQQTNKLTVSKPIDLLAAIIGVCRLTSLRPVHTGDYSRRFRRQFVAEFGDSRRFRRQLPFLATVAEFGDYSRQCGQAITKYKGEFTFYPVENLQVRKQVCDLVRDGIDTWTGQQMEIGHKQIHLTQTLLLHV